MMKIVFLVLLAGIFVVENEAWGPRIRLPKIRLPRIRLPKIRVPSIRIPVLKPISIIYDKATSILFAKAYGALCGDPLKSNCGNDLVTRVLSTCSAHSCLKRKFKFGKRSVDSSDFNAETLVNNDLELSKSKRSYLALTKLALKGGKIYNKCCLNACRDSDIVEECV